MNIHALTRRILIFMFGLFSLAGCRLSQPVPTSSPEIQAPTTTPSPTSGSELSVYAFPDTINRASRYLFYLHGRIIEDQGIPAISPDYGEYEYVTILEKFSSYNFVVISEQRPKDTDGMEYAKKVAEQVVALLNAGVPAKNITVVGASKGAGIAIEISHLLENEEINFVIMGICNPYEIEFLKQNQTILYGNILSIYDSVDEFAGSCQEIFTLSEGRGLARHDEIVLHVGGGHGILYKPLDEWVIPAVEWARGG